MKNEIALPIELNEVLDKSSITDLTKAQTIASNYAPLMEAVTEQMDLLQKLDKGNEEHLEPAKRIRLDLGKICSLADKQKKEDKDLLLLETRFIDALFNTVNGAARLTQSEAKDIENHFAQIEEKKMSDLQDKRAKELSKYIEDAHERDLSSMETDVWEAYLQTKKQAHIDLLAAEKKAEADRIAKEKADKVERERVAKENKKLKAEALAKEKSEAELKVKNELLNKAGKARQEMLFEIDVNLNFEDCKNMPDNTWKEFYEKQNNAYQSKQNEIALEKLKQDKEIKAERAEKAKVEAELKAKNDDIAKAESDRLAAIEAELTKGDASKKTDLINELVSIKTKYSFKSKKNQKMYEDVHNLIDKVIAHIK